jgi:hypothetical protein
VDIHTWIRVEDEYGQFDVRKGERLPKGVTKVANYPEYVGPTARDSKAKTAKSGTRTSDTSSDTGKNTNEAGDAGKESE